MADFNGLYEFVSSSGTIIPDTESFRSKVEAYFKEKFGNDFDLSETSIGGRLVEAITMLGVTVLGVNAQNGNILNPERCVGQMLDSLAGLFGIERGSMNDEQLRKNLLKGFAPGNGFDPTIDRAVLNVAGVDNVVVLVNRYRYPCVFPADKRGIAVSEKSIYVCVHGGDDNEIARAIHRAASIRCGMAISTEGQKVEVSDTIGNITDTIIFYRPIEKQVSMTLTVKGVLGVNAEQVKSDIEKYLEDKRSNAIITMTELAAVISKYGVLSATNITQDVLDDDGNVVIKPSQYATYAVEIVNE